jgi:hypothetical protein
MLARASARIPLGTAAHIARWLGGLAPGGSKGGETRYPDLDCRGKLIRVGASKSYAFFIEIITKGAADKGGAVPRRYDHAGPSG